MTSRGLFSAILSLDSYNRNYGQNVILNRGDSTTGQNEASRQLGNATILDIRLPENSVALGFYAIAYDVSDVAGFAEGERVIAYRGTNANWDASSVEAFLASPIITDALNGWIVGVPDLWTAMSLDPVRTFSIPANRACSVRPLAAANDDGWYDEGGIAA